MQVSDDRFKADSGWNHFQAKPFPV